MLRSLLRALGIMLALGAPVHAQGTLPITLTQQFAFTACSTTTTICGTPLIGGQLFFYQAGTVATPQQSYQDTGLSITNRWPLILDSNGRVPAFYLANGSVHVRLTDSAGIVQFDYPNMLVIGPSSGSGGGSSVDPTTIASTGDIKFRSTGETIAGWVKLNGLTIGNAISGATGRANADTQNLFVYEWTNCGPVHCPVVGGAGANALADFNANKQLTLPDLRGRMLAALDDMGNTAAGRIGSGNVTSGGGDGVTTPLASGGFSTQTLGATNLPPYTPSYATNPTFTYQAQSNFNVATSGGQTLVICLQNFPAGCGSSNTEIITNYSFNSNGGASAPLNTMTPFVLGSFYVKL